MLLKYKFDKTGATASESSIINNLGDKPTRMNRQILLKNAKQVSEN